MVKKRAIKKKAAKKRARRPATPPTRPLDAVERYARQVLAGEVVAGRAVRQACERHLHDLARQRTPAFPYYWDRGAAEHVIAFFPTFLTLENGQEFVLPEWLQFCYGSIWGWKRVSDGGRRFIYGFFETSKGSGKTPSGGGIGLYGMTFEDQGYAEIYSAGFDKGQASIMLNDAIRMASSSPDLSEMLQIDTYNIANLTNGSFFRAVSSEHRGKSGPRPYIVLGDEIHEHRDGRVINKLTAGFKGHSQPLALLYTNSGSDKTSICWEYHDKSLKVLERSLIDEQWFAYVCHLDPCESCYRDGYRQPKDGCPHCDNWLDPAVWPKVAPALGIVIQPKYLQDQVDKALSIPSEMALVKRLNFCIWTETHTVWIPADAWAACQVAPSTVNLEGVRAAAFDMSEKLDLTSCVVGVKTEVPTDGPAPTVEITELEGDEEIKKTFALNFFVDLYPYFWLPEATLRKRVNEERVPLDVWRNQGHLRVTPGPVIDYDLIYEQFCSEIGKKFKPSRVGYDPHNATQFALQLRDKAKYTVVEIAQGRKLSEAFKLFEALVHLKRIRHHGNPAMAWCVANAEARRDRYQNLWVEKPSETKRIDGLIAAVMVLSQLMVMPPEKRRRPLVAKVFTPEGFRPLDGPGSGGGDAARA
jgi:phage terminase large subunit-like protein